MFLSCFTPFCVAIYVIFSGFTSFFCMSLLSISFIPCLWFPFLCVSVFM